MNMTSPKNRFHIFTLDNIGSTAVLAAAVMGVASGAFSAFTDSTVSSVKVARQVQTENRPVVAATRVMPAPQKALITLTTVRPIIVATNR